MYISSLTPNDQEITVLKYIRERVSLLGTKNSSEHPCRYSKLQQVPSKNPNWIAGFSQSWG